MKYISEVTAKGNSSYSYISHEHAKERAKRLDDNGCTNCTDCNHCTKCTNCTKCDFCIDCTNCTDCYNCTDCTDVSRGVSRGVL